MARGKTLFFIPFVLTFLSGCSGRSEIGKTCSTVKAEGYTRTIEFSTLERFLRGRDAAGGEIVIEYRKDDLMARPSHQKSCAFFLEPSQATSEGGSVWTAGHCLDSSTDSRYRLRFYVDFATGYIDIPVEIQNLQNVELLRENLASKFSPDVQREILSGLKRTEIDYSNSKNATDICLDSFGSGQSKFHRPIPGENQIACFLYQDLSLISFKVPANLTETQKNIMQFALEKARKFENAQTIQPTALLQLETAQMAFSDFRRNWIDAYKNYSKYREIEGFKNWVANTKQKCANAAELLAICNSWTDAKKYSKNPV